MFDTIPPKIHFVWVGKPIPAKQAGVVLEWSRRNPGYTVHLWTDRPAENAKELARYWDVNPARVRISDAHAEALPGRHSNYRYTNDTYKVRQAVRLHHIQVLIEALGAELAGRAAQEFYHGNYGGTSDILRIAVLKKEGGVYLDTDSEPASPLPSPLKAKDAILFGYFEGAQNTFCNAVIAAPQGHEYLDEIKASIEAEYRVWSAPQKAANTPHSEARFTRLIDQQRKGVDNARKSVAAAKQEFDTQQTKLGAAELGAQKAMLQNQLQSLTLTAAGPNRIVHWLFKHVMDATQRPVKSLSEFQKQKGVTHLTHLAYGGGGGLVEQYWKEVVKPVLAEPIVKTTYRFPEKHVTIKSDASWIQ